MFENTPQYQLAILEDKFGHMSKYLFNAKTQRFYCLSQGRDYDIRSARFCSRHLGFSAARARLWVVMTRKGRARWTTNESLESLVKVFFAAPQMQATCLLC